MPIHDSSNGPTIHVDNERDLTPEDRAKMRRVYARLAHGYDTTGSKRTTRTQDEQALLSAFADRYGQAYVDQWGELLLVQARAFGDL